MKYFRLTLAGIVMGTGLSHAAWPADDWDRGVSFADSLMLQQRFRESELEYERLAATHPDHTGRLIVIQKMFDAAMATEDYTFSLKLARAWENQLNGNDACLPSLYETHSLYQLGNYAAVLKQPIPSGCESGIVDQKKYLRGLSRLRLWQWPEARQEFEQIPVGSDLGERAARAARRSDSESTITRKSPALAAGLNAVLPGAGYLYADRPQTAVACLVVNGLFIWGTVASIHAKEPGLAALLSMFSFAWYFGGVYGSAQAAEKETQSRLSAFIEPLELTH